MLLLVTGSAFCVGLTLTIGFDEDLRLLAVLIAVLTGFQVLGSLLVIFGKRVVGARLVLIGSLPMIPIGIPAALGARRVLDEVERAKGRGCGEA